MQLALPKMGAPRPKLGSPLARPWQLQQSSSTSVAISCCQTLGLLLLATVVVFSVLRVLPTEPPAAVTIPVDVAGNASNDEQHHHLTAVIVDRVFNEDLFNITAYECYQWIEYMLFAGVEHIYWYDTAHSDEESQLAHLQKFVDDGLLTYHRFYHLFPERVGAAHYHFEQFHSYEHFLSTHNDDLTWVVEIDVDEYPFMVSDQRRSFLRRYVEHLEERRPDVTQILMPCMIFAGNPKGDLEDGWVIERYKRRKRATEGARARGASRTKPIFKAKFAQGVRVVNPHQFPMTSGETVIESPDVLRMNHYWGPRLSNFKPDTRAVLAMLVPDSSAQSIATELRGSTGWTRKAMFRPKVLDRAMAEKRKSLMLLLFG